MGISTYIYIGVVILEKEFLMKAFKKVFVAAAISALTIISYAVATAQPAMTSSTSTPTKTTSKDISGTYKCSGYDPYDKTNYNENIVFKKTDETYSIQLIHDDSVVPYNLGTGVMSKNVDNAIALVYWDPQKPTTMGTELFEIKSDGSLDGVWTSSGTKVIGTELCSKTQGL